MAHEIEADFKEDWPDEEKQCCRCTSFSVVEGKGFCAEAKSAVSPKAHCDFFQSID
jgi:hypothetical protein